jgi:hypothetical protein
VKESDGIVLWLLIGTGVLFLYAAYKNVTPQTLLFSHSVGAGVVKSQPISTYSSAPTVGSPTAQGTITQVQSAAPVSKGGLIST